MDYAKQGCAVFQDFKEQCVEYVELYGERLGGGGRWRKLPCAAPRPVHPPPTPSPDPPPHIHTHPGPLVFNMVLGYLQPDLLCTRLGYCKPEALA